MAGSSRLNREKVGKRKEENGRLSSMVGRFGRLERSRRQTSHALQMLGFASLLSQAVAGSNELDKSAGSTCSCLIRNAKKTEGLLLQAPRC